MSLEIVFITSSKIKLAHAQHLCRDYNINITSYRIKHYGVGYEEPRIYNREQLLDESYKDALDRWKKYTSNNDKMFIIEDTSVRIDALSDKVNEVPGLDIKYWMKENSFESVDKLLKSKGNNRKCTVRSDIILHLTDDLSKKYKKDYLQFTSTTDGCIVDKEFELNTNPIYPWLDNKTFNKWFVPNGENLPMSKLSIELADKYDFRSGAFNSMLDLLELADKIPKDSYKQIYLNFNPLYIICGPTCAGKSTLSKYLSDNYSYFHIEASDFMWLKYHEKHGINSDVTITNFAKKALVDEPSIVTDQIIEFIKQKNLKKVIISGFRSEKEIEFIKNSNIDINDKIEI
ncbi:MAG: non-canonical purine NTP pyrophosphatase, partial [Campylobacterota bacterium]|nr:non-canonical purine NTP pyrophosphatase [Campylobacterota bacterium]